MQIINSDLSKSLNSMFTACVVDRTGKNSSCLGPVPRYFAHATGYDTDVLDHAGVMLFRLMGPAACENDQELNQESPSEVAQLLQSVESQHAETAIMRARLLDPFKTRATTFSNPNRIAAHIC
nr:hypothetical protein CFP56_71100 [Quercus suber]